MSKDMIAQPIIFSPAEIGGILNLYPCKGFNIPIYQRLYAWGNKEITRLLEDIENSIPSKKEYYIGNITLNYNETTHFLDVIDGQQRLTTIWLIALVLKLRNNPEWNSFASEVGHPLLNFTARQQDTRYLHSLISQHSVNGIFDMSLREVNPHMVNAIKTINRYMATNLVLPLHQFSSFIYKNLKMVAIFLPSNIDLNKYFEDMNNRGLQLEPHQIIKADLLSGIADKNLQDVYAQVWDAISQMNSYLEYNLAGTARENRSILANKNDAFNRYLKFYQTNTTKAAPLSDIIDQAVSENKAASKSENKKPVKERTGTILNFQEFLLHALRIYTGDGEVSVDDKQLLNEFSVKKQDIIPEDFIRCLFECRVIYDDLIIKSITGDQGTQWEINRINASDEDFSREPLTDEVVQLQAMLNVSVAPSLWFTETLKYIKDNDPPVAGLIKKIEKIDFRISKSMRGNRDYVQLLDCGTDTGRYWFYKLDYILWRYWKNGTAPHPQIDEIKGLNRSIANFQFRDSRSVEHIEPRNPEVERWRIAPGKVDPGESLKRLKDRFGNLALISISSNSSYNNQSSKDKKHDFIAKTNKRGLESLKLVDAYSYDDWTVENMIKHQEKMLAILDEYHQEFPE